jgi:hypothetical protein
MSHPNQTDELLSNQIQTPPPRRVIRTKRDLDWDSDYWDNTWENPMPAPSPTATFQSKYYKVNFGCVGIFRILHVRGSDNKKWTRKTTIFAYLLFEIHFRAKNQD